MFTPFKQLFLVNKYSKRLHEICQQRDLNVHESFDLVEVDSERKVAFFRKEDPQFSESFEEKVEKDKFLDFADNDIPLLNL